MCVRVPFVLICNIFLVNVNGYFLVNLLPNSPSLAHHCIKCSVINRGNRELIYPDQITRLDLIQIHFALQ